MNRAFLFAGPLLAALALAACNAGGSSTMPGSAGQPVSQSGNLPQWQRSHSAAAACPGPRTPDLMQCDALIVSPTSHGISPGVTVHGWAPIDFQTAYNLPSATKGAGNVVAIVDAYDQPNAETDLAMYRSQFGLGTANFTRYNQKGQQSHYPATCHQPQDNWCVEIDLDIEMVSAVCPKCSIILVEGDSNSTKDLYAAVKEAVALGAHIVSNSYSDGSGGGAPQHGAFSHKGVTYLASAGDAGFGIGDPADYDDVVSVGGTVLQKSGSTYSEMTWPDTGSGCSTDPKPAWQHDTGCTFRTANDVSAVAFQVAEYDAGDGGWFEVGGTSVSSPMIAGVFGLTKNFTKQQGGKHIWQQKAAKYAKDLHDITTGHNGSCSPSYLCTAGTGYDGPTGWGTPNGIAAF